jgi:hypothetical protein
MPGNFLVVKASLNLAVTTLEKLSDAYVVFFFLFLKSR